MPYHRTYKRSKESIRKGVATRKRNEAAKRERAAHPPSFLGDAQNAPPLESHYVGEQPKVDVNRLEERAFRRGMFTAFQMIIDLFLRELR